MGEQKLNILHEINHLLSIITDVLTILGAVDNAYVHLLSVIYCNDGWIFVYNDLEYCILLLF